MENRSAGKRTEFPLTFLLAIVSIKMLKQLNICPSKIMDEDVDTKINGWSAMFVHRAWETKIMEE